MGKNLKSFAIYLLLAVIAYWQVALFQNMLKWDMVDVYLPWRSFISESILNFHFPLWNPYQDFGYPIHADMRSVWAPEVWLVSLFGGYSIYTFSGLFIIYTSIAGIGMKLLSNIFLKNNKAAFFTGAIYMLSGFLTGHGQELSTINSFAFVPIVLYQYLKFYDNISIKRGVSFILSVFVLLSSAYQAHSFIMLYLLIILFSYFFIKLIRGKQGKLLKLFILYHIAFVIIITIVFLPVAISAYQVLPWVSRLNSGVNPMSISILSFSPQSLLSLIIPFAVIRNMEFFNTDLSMTNLYFGIIPLALLIVYFFKIKRGNTFNLIFAFGFFALIASFGDYTPLRKILFDYIPFMNLFKGSAYFRLFTLIAFSIASGYVLLKIKEYKKQVLLAAFFVLAVVLAFTVHGLININFKELSFIKPQHSLVDLLSGKSSYFENMFVHGVVQIVFLAIFILLVIKNRATYKNTILLTIINLIIAVQLNIYSTVVSKYTQKKTNKYLSGFPVGFPVPEAFAISECTDKSVSEPPLWRNTSMLAKQVSGDSFNSFKLDKTSEFEDTYANLCSTVTNNSLLYFSNNIKPLSEINRAAFNKSTLFISDSVYSIYKHLADTNRLANSSYIITKFGPNSIEVNAKAEKHTFLTLIQTNYNGWRIYVDNKPAELIESNTIFLSIYIPKGSHKISYAYKNGVLIKTFVVSAILLFLLIIVAFYFYLKKPKTQKGIFITLFVITAFIVLYKQYDYRSSIDKFSKVLQKSVDEGLYFLLDNSVNLNIKNSYSVNLTDRHNINELYNFLANNYYDTVLLTVKNRRIQPEFNALFPLFYNKTKVLLNLGHSKIIMYYHKKQQQPYYFNGFDNIFDNSIQVHDSLANSYFECQNEEYIENFSLILNKGYKNKRAIAIIDVLPKQLISKGEILLVFTIEKDGKNYYWSANDLIDFYNNSKKASIFMKSLDLDKIDYPDGSELKIYIWNPKNEQFFYDDLKVVVY